MTDGLLDWLASPRADAGIFYLGSEGAWERRSYVTTARDVHQAAHGLVEAGLERGGIVALALETGPDFVAGYFGTLLAGGIPTTIPSLNLGQSADDFTDHIAAILRVADPAVIVSGAGSFPLLEAASERASLGTRPMAPCPASTDDDLPRRPLAELGLLQFTSGSSGSPRGVQLSLSNLEANVAMIREWLCMTPDHGTASWLPLYHDMGLIGCMITPVLNQSDLYMMQPTQFVQHPLRWLECFGLHGARVTAAPNFCLEYLLRIGQRPRYEEEVEAMDFSRWEALILGAERIDPSAMRRFADWLAPRGFGRKTFMPAYGLAEATLCVTGVALDERSWAQLPNWETLALGRPVEVLDTAEAVDERIGTGGGWLTGCGRPMTNVEVAIVDQEGAPVPDGVVGEIQVHGPTICTGYRGADNNEATVGKNQLRTGDVGFLHDGQLYVIGRMGDSLKIRGRSVFVEDLEAKLAELAGAEPGQFVVVPGTAGTEDSVLVVAERSQEGWPDAALGRLRQELGSGVELGFLAVPRGFILRTSSGKPRRRVIWQRLASTRPARAAVPRAGTDDVAVGVLRVLRLRGRASAAAVAASLGAEATAVEEVLRCCEEGDSAVYHDGRIPGWSLTDAGREEITTLLASEQEAIRAGDEVICAYERFIELNGDLKQLCTDWQMGSHRDAVRRRLEPIDQGIRSELKAAAAELPRLQRYAERLAAAADRFRSGDDDALTRPLSESYHDIWMELHQDLLLTLGRERSAADGH